MNVKNIKLNQSKVPAIVLGSSITALGVIRCLGMAKIPSLYITNNSSYITHSRWCKSKVTTSENLSDVHNLTEILEDLPLEQSVLFPCSDSLLMAVAALKPELKERFPASHPDIESIKLLLDKAGLADILKIYDLPHPKTFIIEKEDDLKYFKEINFENIFLKPRESHKFFKHYGVKAFQVENREDAIKKVCEIHKAGYSLVLQDYIPGPKSNHYFIDGFVDRFGEVKSYFARRRIRMYPPDFGNSSYMYSVPLKEVYGAVRILDRFFKHFRYRGIFSAEFKYDIRDALFKLIEINVRPWWYVEFASTCGVNVCKLAYQDALKENVNELNSYQVGGRLVYAYYDLLSFYQLHSEKKIKFWGWILTWPGAKHPIFNWRDPMPAIVKFISWLKLFLKRRISR